MNSINYKTVLLIIPFVLTLMNCNEKSKNIISVKKQKNNLQVSQKQTRDTLRIVGNNIWIRQTPKTGKVTFKFNDNYLCEILEKGVKDTIRKKIDFWYKVDNNNQIGWVFGSQTTESQQLVMSDGFNLFIKDFLDTSFYGKNTDSLLRYQSGIIYKYVNKEIGFTRFYNPGIACVPQAYNKHNSHYENNPKLNLNLYNEIELNNGFCEESSNKDGIYIYDIKELPEYPSGKEYDMIAFPLPKKYKNAPLKVVTVLYKKWIVKTLYFIKADNKWNLVLINDCDCSA